MAISRPHYFCLKELHRRGELPQGGALLEIGEANWYGDIPFVLRHAIDIVDDSGKSIPRGGDLTGFRAKPLTDPFKQVKELYGLLFGTWDVMSIDMQGPNSLRLDLNYPVLPSYPCCEGARRIESSPGDQTTLTGGWCPEHGNTTYYPGRHWQPFRVVINHGTLEHIFNPAQVLRTMHDHCEVGGLMIHESPFTGWIDHGFFTIQPTLYYDLAAANGYDLRYMAVTHIEHGSAVEIDSREQLLKMAASGGVANNSMLFVAMRKVKDEEFKIPMQGFYAQSISSEASEAWRSLR